MISQNTTYALMQGTYQDDRLLEALNPESVKLDDRSLEDLVGQLYEHASHLHFFEDNPDNAKGDWRAFFSDIVDPLTLKPDMKRLEALEKDSSLPPHLALAVTFLRLFASEQEAMNGLTSRHLDFYYEDLLKFKRKEGTIGNVPVMAELARNVDSVAIPRGSKFSAGKDRDGKEIIYEAAADYLLGTAKVEALSSPNPEEGGYFLAIASPMLSIGEENVSVRLTNTESLVGTALQYTMKEGWSGEVEYKDKEIELTGCAPFDEKVHGTGMMADGPVIRFVFASAVELCRKVGAALPRVKSVTVQHGTSISLLGKFGPMENVRGLQPFGPIPSPNDCFTVIVPTIEGCITKVKNGETFRDTKQFKQEANGNRLKIKILNDCGYSNYLKELVVATKKLSEDGNAEIVMPVKPSAPILEDPISVPYYIQEDGVGETSIRYIITPMGYSVVKDSAFIEDEHLAGRNVYIGFSGVRQGTSITLFIKMASDSLANDLDIVSADLPVWSILEGNEWKDIGKVVDTTMDLTVDGFVKIVIGGESKFMTPHTILPSEYTWIRIKYGEGEECYPSIEAVCAQAIELKFDPSSPGKPEAGVSLSKDVISKPLYSISGLKRVSQPFSGFPGRPDESEREFRIRVSERLRHKGRSITIHDYERIVLQAFPEIAAVRCIPSDCSVTGGPGTVNIVLVPKAEGIVDRCPRLKAGTLKSVHELLMKTASPFAEIRVQNPTYEEVGVKCRILLRSGFTDENASLEEIKKRLTTFIAPWADGTRAVSLTNNLNESRILQFLESLPYVDSVSGLSLTVSSGMDTRSVGEGEDILPLEKYSVLTSGKDFNISISRQ